MSENYNISPLFDVSGNLTLNAMERYLRGELSPGERALVESHLADSDFDREAIEGLQKNGANDLRKEVADLQAEIQLVAEKREKTGSSRISPKTYWYAAAALAGLICLSVLMFFMFRNPVEKPQLAVAQQDTIIDNVTTAAGQSENSRITENTREQEPQKVIITPVNNVVETPPAEAEITLKTIQKEAIQAPVEPAGTITLANENAENEDDVMIEEQMVGGVAVIEDNASEQKMTKSMAEAASENYQVTTKSSLTGMDRDVLASIPDTGTSEVFVIVEQMPEFPGGEEALYRFLSDSIHYPAQARESGIQGRVFIRFIVNKDGSLYDIKVLRGIGGGCDEEAVRVIKSMPKWIPGRQRNKAVPVQYNLPIKFSLD